MPVLSVAELQSVLDGTFPDSPPPYVIEETGEWGVRIRLPVTDAHSRPGGTVAGPALMALADAAAWLAILAQIGPVLLAVTTSLHIDFLRKPDLVDVGHLLKLGKQLAVVDVALRSVGHEELVAKSQVTYSIPPR